MLCIFIIGRVGAFMSLIIIQALLQSYIKHDKSMDPLKTGVLKLIYIGIIDIYIQVWQHLLLKNQLINLSDGNFIFSLNTIN